MPTSISSSLKARHHVTAILVAHDGATWLPEVVASLTKQKLEIDQIIAVDTGSKDDSIKLLRNAGITTIAAPRDTGFGAAIELALKSSKLRRTDGERTEWLWLIHDDCAPHAEALRELMVAVDERPNVGMAGPKLRGWYDRNHLLEVGVSIAGNGARWTGLEFREQDQGQHDGIHEVMAVSTAAALIRREVFEELGGFDPELTLFRDDVDFGWRCHTSGHSVIAVPTAIAFHAEAAANERRPIDVKNAFLHRPLLLDRRHAAYVLMVNASLWLTPFLAIQLLGSAIFRALGFLIAKLPGYALDELTAVALVLAQPQDLFRARRKRRETRLLSSRVIARFVPPRGAQLGLAIDKARDAISRAWRGSALVKVDVSNRTSMLDFNDESMEEMEPQPTSGFAPLRAIKARPILTSTVLIFIASLIAFRGRLGDLVGGALPLTPSSGIDLLRQYADSWHSVGLGSSVNMPPWTAILGLASLLTFFDLKLFVTLLFVLAVPLAFFGAYRLARKFTELHFLALAAALLYAFSAVGIAAINGGRLGTLVLFVIGPWLIRPLLGMENLESLTWRKTWWLVLLLTIVFSFSPLTFATILLWQFLLIILDVIYFNNKTNPLTKEIFDIRNARRIALIIGPIVTTAPWSLEMIIHPSRLLLDPGLTTAGGSVISVLFANPGGAGGLPIWLISPVLFIALCAIFINRTARLGEVALFFIGLAMIFGSRQVSGHGSFLPESLWVGSLLVIPTLASILAGVVMIDKYVPQLAEAPIDYRHLLLGIGTVISAVSIVASLGSWLINSPSAPLQRSEKSALPAFLSAQAQTTERFKTLVIRSENDRIAYFIARDRDLQLGDPDVTVGLSPVVNRSIEELVTGTGIDSSRVLAEFGIRYVFLAKPVDENLVKTIDGVGGFTRASNTDDGVTWKVSGALAQISFLSSDGTFSALPSGRVGATGNFAVSGTVIVTEKYDSRWRLLINGREIDAVQTENGVVRFAVDEPGDFIIYHDATSRRGWISLQIIILTSLLILALPARRRRREMELEELS
ncbi:MAG: hypothetical protein RLZZ99_73 [Actinomycetota bacterium]